MLIRSPQVLDAARNGSFSALMELSDCWDRVPELLDMGVLEVFYGNLDASEIPDLDVPESLACDRAYTSLFGLTRLGRLKDDKAGRKAAERLLESWPGIFKWASYIFAVQVKPTALSPKERRSGMTVGAILKIKLRCAYFLYILSRMLYAICKQEIMRPAVLDTPGVIEMATFIWFFEGSILAPSTIGLPMCTIALDTLLPMGDADCLNRAMAASGGKPDAMAKLVIKHIKTEMKKPAIDNIRATVSLKLLCKFCVLCHPVHYACLAQGAVGTVTRLLARIAQMAVSQTSWLDLIVDCFAYIRNSLQSKSTDGFAWVSEAVKAEDIRELESPGGKVRGKVRESGEQSGGRVRQSSAVRRQG